MMLDRRNLLALLVVAPFAKVAGIARWFSSSPEMKPGTERQLASEGTWIAYITYEGDNCWSLFADYGPDVPSPGQARYNGAYLENPAVGFRTRVGPWEYRYQGGTTWDVWPIWRNYTVSYDENVLES